MVHNARLDPWSRIRCFSVRVSVAPQFSQRSGS